LNRRRPLTALAHELLGGSLQPGAKAIDATAGNGHDTLFLAQAATLSGQVYAFDIQQQALQNTAERLQRAGLSESVTLCHSGHENMLRQVPEDWPGEVSAITFNLGYLPGSDKQTTTVPGPTLQALDQAMQLLRPGGALSILAYRGHAGGRQEAEAVSHWLAQQNGLECQTHESPGPVLYHCTKKP